MRKLLLLAIFILACAPLSFAQTTSDEYNKVEFYGGYSHNRVDTGFNNNDPEFDDIIDEREGFNGFEAAITGNVHKYVGLKFDVSGAYRSDNFTSGGFSGDVNSSIYNFLGGVQLKDNRKEGGKVRPFAHFLAGAAHQRVNVNSPDLNALIGVPSFESDDTSFALGIGGGLDVRVSPRVDIRAIQLDYNPIFTGDQTIQGQTFTGETQHNFRIGVGIVIH
jgi:opacity protein-like surface antigen